VLSSGGDVFVRDGVATCRCWCVRDGEGNVIFPDLCRTVYITYALPPPGPRPPPSPAAGIEQFCLRQGSRYRIGISDQQQQTPMKSTS
jgi:hypothetical protein